MNTLTESFALALDNVNINSIQDSHDAAAHLLSSKGNDLTVTRVDLNGPSDGWPEITFQGPADQVKAFMEAYEDGEI